MAAQNYKETIYIILSNLSLQQGLKVLFECWSFPNRDLGGGGKVISNPRGLGVNGHSVKPPMISERMHRARYILSLPIGFRIMTKQRVIWVATH